MKDKKTNNYEKIHSKHEFYIFDDLQLVYLSFAKVASSSIKATFAEKYGLEWHHWKELHRFKLWEQEPQKNKPKMRHGLLTERENNYFKFVFVRNPFDRLVSCYHNKILDENYFAERYPFYDRYPLKHKISFEEFVEIVTTIPDDLADEHIKPQSSYLNDPNMNILFDFVGRFENLNHDWRYLANRFGFTPHLNKINNSEEKKWVVPKREYKSYYTPLLLERVYNYYQEDVRLLRYTNEYEELYHFVASI